MEAENPGNKDMTWMTFTKERLRQINMTARRGVLSSAMQCVISPHCQELTWPSLHWLVVRKACQRRLSVAFRGTQVHDNRMLALLFDTSEV